MLNFQKISNLFQDFLNNSGSRRISDAETLEDLIVSCIGVNQTLWRLEDRTRMKNLGFKSIALAKAEINKNNQRRNDLIKKMDLAISKALNNHLLDTKGRFYAESPGMIIDRLSILFIKLSVLKKINSLIKEEGLKREYLEKEKTVSSQINDLGEFLDLYFSRIREGEMFFKIQQPIKIYNDERIKKYIKVLDRNLNT